jgi:hypothetical protein
MNPQPLVSIIINNYNYARYVGRAIESALSQSYPRLEVIVVDDGSTDRSAAVIASYADRLAPVFKENGGQASAFNVGLAHSQGEIVIFLDADDELYAQVVQQIVAAFAADPQVVRVQYRLAVIDETGRATGATKPPGHRAVPQGELHRQVLLFGDDLPWLPTSGNAFSAAMLRQLFPMPEAPYRLCADYYLSNLTPLFGKVAALPGIGGNYRVHGANQYETAQLDLAQVRQIVQRTRQTHELLTTTARRLGLAEAADEVAALSITYPANRLVSLRLDPAHHPLPGDTRWALMGCGMRAAWQRSDLAWSLRLCYLAWFVGAALLPRPVVKWLAVQFFYPEARGRRLSRALAALHRLRPALPGQQRAAP